jgi:hypothetical protein
MYARPYVQFPAEELRAVVQVDILGHALLTGHPLKRVHHIIGLEAFPGSTAVLKRV